MHNKIVADNFYPIQILYTKEEQAIVSENIELLGAIGQLNKTLTTRKPAFAESQDIIDFLFTQRKLNLSRLNKALQEVLARNHSDLELEITRDLGVSLFDNIFSQIKGLKQKINPFIDVQFHKEIAEINTGKGAKGAYFGNLNIKFAARYHPLDTIKALINDSKETTLLSSFYRTFMHEVWHHFHRHGQTTFPSVPQDIVDFYSYVTTNLAAEVAQIVDDFSFAVNVLADEGILGVKPKSMEEIQNMLSHIDSLIDNPLLINQIKCETTCMGVKMETVMFSALLSSPLAIETIMKKEGKDGYSLQGRVWQGSSVEYSKANNSIAIKSTAFKGGSAEFSLNKFWNEKLIKQYAHFSDSIYEDGASRDLVSFISTIQQISNKAIRLKSFLKKSMSQGCNIVEDKRHFFKNPSEIETAISKLEELTNSYPEWFKGYKKDLMDFVTHKMKSEFVANLREIFKAASVVKDNYLAKIDIPVNPDFSRGEMHSNLLTKGNKKQALESLTDFYGIPAEELLEVELIEDLSLLGVPNWEIANLVQNRISDINELKSIRDKKMEEFGYKNKTATLALLRRKKRLKVRLAQLQLREFIIRNVVEQNHFQQEDKNNGDLTPTYFDGFYYSDLSKTDLFIKLGMDMKEEKQLLENVNRARYSIEDKSSFGGLLE